MAATATLNGLDGAYGIAISPDGKFVYVSSITDDSIVVLRRNAKQWRAEQHQRCWASAHILCSNLRMPI